MSRKCIFLGNFIFLSGFEWPIFFKNVPANGPVDFLSRCFAFRGRFGEPPRRVPRLRGLTCPVLPQESSHLPLQSTGDNQLKELQHTFSSLNKCVAIFFVFWQATVRRACSLAFFTPQPAVAKPMQLFESAKLRSIFSFQNLYSSFPDFDKRFTLTFSLNSSHTCRVTTFTLIFKRVHWNKSGQPSHFFESDLYSLNTLGLLSCRVILGY